MIKTEYISNKKNLSRKGEARKFRVVVIGGGISGLSSAYHLRELCIDNKIPLELIVLEKSERLGGLISSKTINNFIIEEGPDSFNNKKKSAINLINRIGIKSNIIFANEKADKVYVYKNKKLIPIPDRFMIAQTSFCALVSSKLFSLKGKFRIILETLLPRNSLKIDESVASFFRRRFGEEVFRLVAEPLFGGIYSSDTNNLSMQATLPHLLALEKQYGSIIKGMRRNKIYDNSNIENKRLKNSMFVSFRNGMQHLTDTLANQIPKESVKLNKMVRKIKMKNEKWQVITSSNEVIDTDCVIIATPATNAAKILREFNPLLANCLSDIEYVSTVTINLIYKREGILNDISGSGFIVPKSEDLPVSACTFSSIKFSGRTPANNILMRCFIGGEMKPEIYKKDDSWFIEEAHESISRVFGIESRPIFKLVSRNSQSIPQYMLGHVNRVSRIFNLTEQYPNLQLAGNAYNGVGIPDCIKSGENAAKNIFKYIKSKENSVNL
ncbi:MAG: protoporphyrinogen oxidase [Candidatus Dadabacteria bacterium]|nr:protoporphyrinogen oxidase [Candidatus Dadabacteria bacterium]NIQ13712.1 protoporphyrinogen oxidase [Candidatus Dadabacteria bacterium]